MKSRIGFFALTMASALAMAVSANAADVYRVPEAVGGYKDGPAYAAADWSGFYAGGNGGYAFDARNTHGGVEDNGGFGGGQIGYNWQGIPHLVLGIEADIQGSGIDNKGVTTLIPSGQTASHEISIDYFGTVRGRLGYAAGPLLIYGTGGLAYGGVNNRFVVTSTGNVFATNNTQTGFAAGGGLEYKFSPAWSAKVEYQYIDLSHDNAVLSTHSVILGPLSPSVIQTRDTELNTVRAGINYHFGSVYQPLK